MGALEVFVYKKIVNILFPVNCFLVKMLQDR